MSRSRGFSIIELLIAVLIIGIIASIAIGNYFNAVHRAKQKRTMADIRTVAVAWESRAVDTKQYNAAAASYSVPAAQVSGAEMMTMLIPTYIRSLPIADAWGYTLDFRIDQPLGSTTAAASYGIRSRGRDGKFMNPTTYTPGPTTDYDCDIVYANGQFIVYPEGVQQK